MTNEKKLQLIKIFNADAKRHSYSFHHRVYRYRDSNEHHSASVERENKKLRRRLRIMKNQKYMNMNYEEYPGAYQPYNVIPYQNAVSYYTTPFPFY
jgi:hypothetical protein